MPYKAARVAILFLLFSSVSPLADAATSASVDAEVSEFVQKKDWSNVVSLLKPLQGQNFEHDLTLAKAYLSLERRSDAQKLLAEMLLTRRDERVLKLRDLASTQFFDQETANLYYEGIRHLSNFRISEAKDRFDQALKAEPSHGLVLLRLVQIELLNGSKDPLEEHLTTAQELLPGSVELKIFAGRAHYNKEEYRDAFRVLYPIRDSFFQHQLVTLWWLDSLLKVNRLGDIAVIQNRVLKDHANWSGVILWFLKGKTLSANERKNFQAQLERNLKDPAKMKTELEQDAKRSQYFWIGYLSPESIKADWTQYLADQAQKKTKP